ncbi:MAG: Rpn family recombination-promoting nuclease/putative transposase [Synechococcales bacterium]|nr:Rpn family recombination-promoting nuclease/putative transposase [Synechococcales bacterium]
MRRDSIFYRLFQNLPSLLFELLPDPPANADRYRFDSVAVKEPTFEIDGVFLPPESDDTGVVYFCEVQFQKDKQLYERLFAELFLYFYRNRDRYADWQAVVIYPSRNTEQQEIRPYSVLLQSHHVHRVYLDELGDIEQLPLGVALMVLTTLPESQAPRVARSLLSRSQREIETPEVSRAIIEMVTTIMIYKFTQLNREEVEAMLASKLEETRFYQEVKEEGRQEEGRSLVRRQLTRRCGELPESMQLAINTLSLEQIEALAEALLDFTSLADLEAWLARGE